MNANPWLLAGTTGVGLLQGWLQGRAQKRHFEHYRNRINEISDPDYLTKLRGRINASRAGEFADVARGVQMNAQTAASRTRARFSRAGLSGVGESMGQQADIAAFLEGRNTSARLKMESTRMAMDQRDTEMRAMQALMNSPYGTVSPASAMIAGAGTGLEAGVNAAYADAMIGKEGG